MEMINIKSYYDDCLRIIESNCAINTYIRFNLGGIRDYFTYHHLNWIKRLIIQKKTRKNIKRHCPTCDSYNRCGIKSLSDNKI